MPQPIRTFFSNAILQSLLLAFIIWAVSSITEEKLSQIEENTRNSQDMKIAMVALSTEVPKLTKTMEKFEDRIESIVKHQVEHEKAVPEYRVWKTKVDLSLAKLPSLEDRLDEMGRKCWENSHNIEKCQDYMRKDRQ